MQEITSRNNNIIIDTVKLYDKKYRLAFGRYIAEGEKLSLEAVSSGADILYVFIKKSKSKKFEFLIDYCNNNKIPLYCVSDNVFLKLSKMEAPEGIITVCAIPEKRQLISGTGRLILNNISDPGNMGTIIRTADAFGIKEIIIGDNCVDVYNPKTVRAAMGSIFRVGLIFVATAEAIKKTKQSGMKVFAAVLDSNAEKINGEVLRNSCVVIGNESNGLPYDIIELCTGKVTIPMRGRAESLNASIAAGIIIWEIAKKEE